ncbi:hypothetical protein AB1E18_019042 [Capra hircus]
MTRLAGRKLGDICEERNRKDPRRASKGEIVLLVIMIVLGWMLFVGFACYLGTFPEFVEQCGRDTNIPQEGPQWK